MSRKRYFIVPDVQTGPDVPTNHVDWAAQAIVEYMPDVIVVLGDWWTMDSLSTYDGPGTLEAEGRRVSEDIAVGNEAFERLAAPMNKKIARLTKGKRKRWSPHCVFCFGNHEHRITKAISREPKWKDFLSLDLLKTPGFERYGFLEIVELDGIKFSHYFANTHSGKPIGGSIDNRLNKIGSSFVQGHEQGFLYGIRQFPGSLRRHGLVCGSFYQHNEAYRGAQGTGEWRGCVVLNRVEDGDYDLMPLRMEYLKEKYG